MGILRVKAVINHRPSPNTTSKRWVHYLQWCMEEWVGVCSDTRR